ncbi:MAG: ATP-binding protein [Acidimicrobiales bacterium]
MSRPRAWMSWSSGKDSAWALDALRTQGEVEVIGLLTTVNQVADRVAMHGVRRQLLEAQAARVGLALHVVELPSPCSNEAYQQRMAAAVEAALGEGVSRMAFGDLFLADVRAYREAMLAGTGIEPLFPLWGRPTRDLAGEMVRGGLRAVVTCVDPAQAPARLAGRWYDHDLLSELPAGVDPCGENGELHTFVVDGPGFSSPVEVVAGEAVERDGFVFADLLPAGRGPLPG